jgi:membrane protease YdiL (CAAX protease family)
MTTTAHVSDSTPVRTSPGQGSSPRRRLVAFVRRRPLLTFFVLSCVFSWWPAVLAALGSFSSGLAGFGPFLAAVVVLALTQGRAGVKDLLVRMIRWRVAPSRYLLAVGIPVAVTGLAILLTVVVGGARPSADGLAAWTQIPVVLLLMLVIPTMGGAWEEPGFRGYALGRLEQRFGLSTAPLLLGLFWVLWHLPLMVTGDIPWSDAVLIMAVSVVIAAVYNGSRKSILIAMIMHATNNAVGGEFASQLFAGDDATWFGVLLALVWVLLAAAAIVVQRRRVAA